MKALNTASVLVLAVIVSGALGGAVFSLQLAVTGVVTAGPGGLVFGLFTLIITVPAFMIGAAMFGPLMWLVFRKTRLNRPWSAALIGAATTLIIGIPLFLDWASLEGRLLAAAFFLAGGAGGWLFQRTMEGSRPKRRPVPPSEA